MGYKRKRTYRQFNPLRNTQRGGRNWQQRGIRRELLRAIWRMDEKVECHWCKAEPTLADRLTIDHVISLGEGGKDHPCNCVLACRVCNRRRAKETQERLHKLGIGVCRPWRFFFGQYSQTCAV